MSSVLQTVPLDPTPAVFGGRAVRPQGPPAWPGVRADVTASVQAALQDGSWGLYCGPRSSELEARLREFQQVEQVVLCSSGTAAVELALRGALVGAGHEVVLAGYDFKANLTNVLTVGALPVLVDVRADDAQFDVTQLEAAITEKTRAIIASHLHGGCVEITAVRRLADDRGLFLIEDACQCPGAIINGQRAGSIGHAGVLSFGGSKLLTAGRGGAVLTNLPEVTQRITLYTQRGNEAYPFSELQAAAVLPQLARLDADNRHRLDAVREVEQGLQQLPGLKLLASKVLHQADTHPAFYKVGMRYDATHFGGLSRDKFSQAMRAEGIALDLGFRALHLTHSRRRFRAVGTLTQSTLADSDILIWHHPALLEGSTAVAEFLTAARRLRDSSAPLNGIGFDGAGPSVDRGELGLQ